MIQHLSVVHSAALRFVSACHSVHTQVAQFAVCTFALTVASHLQAEELIPDKALEAAIRWEVFDKRYNKEPLVADDLKNISQVVGRGKGIKSLEGIQHCKVLMKIDLANNEIEDIKPIAELKQLQSIDLSGNKISDISPLAGLTSVQYLQLSKNSIADLAPLKELVNTNSLYLSENQIKSLAAIASLKKLWTLQVASNPLEDASAIRELNRLKTLNLRNTGLTKLDILKGTKELSLLMLDGNPLESLDPLVEVCAADTAKRFAPFLQLYLEPKLVTDQAAAVEKLRAIGVRINPERK